MNEDKSGTTESSVLRFVLHILVVAVFAPAAGGAVYAFYLADWHNAAIVCRFLGSIVGGFVLQLFVLFVTVPIALGTCFICWGASRRGVSNRILWGLLGTGTGLLLGLFFSDWGRLPLSISGWSGALIGTITGLALREVWCRPTDSGFEARA
jgi:hypothetical protein